MSFIGLFGAIMAGGPQEKYRKEEVNGVEVSTVRTQDMGWETAICDENGVHPVERYASKEEAIAGHSEWVRRAESLKSVKKLGYGDLQDDRMVTLRRKK